jgi:hypothetical protein
VQPRKQKGGNIEKKMTRKELEPEGEDDLF